MRIEPELGGVSLVLLGNFNPSIFTPFWFSHFSIVSTEEAEKAEIGVIHPEIVMYRLGNKQIQVELGRFSVETAEAPWISIADFVVKTFGELLPHTPIRQVGINRMVHFSVGSEAVRNSIGKKLAPPAAWGEWGAEIEKSPPELRGGCTSLTMQESWAGPDYRGFVQATLQPSKRIKGNAGIYIIVNHHCEITSNEESIGVDYIISFIQNNFEKSIQKSEWIIDQIMMLKETA